jgi:hypothetical protein
MRSGGIWGGIPNEIDAAGQALPLEMFLLSQT